MAQSIDRNLGLELVRATESAAMSAARWMGRGDLDAVDRAAIEGMRLVMDTVDMDGVVVIGEGEEADAPVLYIGERLGNGQGPHVDVAVDPVDGVGLTARGLLGAVSTVAVAERDTLFFTWVTYMDKIVSGPGTRGVLDITASVATNIRAVARATQRTPEDLTVAVLNRPRHDRLISEVRATGARLRLVPDGDLNAALLALTPDRTGIDMLMGIGGVREGIIAACAARCLGGDMQGRLAPADQRDLLLAATEGIDVDRVLTLDDLCAGDNVFVAATGLTDGELLKGVRYTRRGAQTDSIVMRSASGTVRRIEATHDFARLRLRAGDRYERRVN